MDTILSQRQMTEEDIKLRFITPAITAKWDTDHITMETRITDGRINLKGNMVVREKPKKADYVLYSKKDIYPSIYWVEEGHFRSVSREGGVLQMIENKVAIENKLTLTVREAAEYSNIGINKIDRMLRAPNCPFVLFVGAKKLVKRKEFEEFISSQLQI